MTNPPAILLLKGEEQTKKLISLLVILMLCLQIIGCGENKQTNDSLTVSAYLPSPVFDIAVSRFRQLYPNVDLKVEQVNYEDIEEITQEDYYKKLSTDLMSGTGPDLFWVDFIEMDIYKLMRSGVFADMGPFFENDPDWSWADYNQKCIEAVKYKGKQYVVPLHYTYRLFLTDREMLAESGFQTEHCTNFWSFIDEVKLYENRREKNNDPLLFRLPFLLNDVIFDSGIDWIDYQDKTVNLDTPEIKQLIDFYKDYISPYWGMQNPTAYGADGAAAILKKEAVFEDHCNYAYSPYLTNCRAVGENDAVSFPLRDIHGKVSGRITKGVGVKNNSKNFQNAYKFIKLLLSSENQTAEALDYTNEIPVSNSAARAGILRFDKAIDVDMGSIKRLDQLSKDFADEYMEQLNEIDYFIIQNYQPFLIFLNNIKPYIRGEKGYQECIKQAEYQLKIYLSE